MFDLDACMQGQPVHTLQGRPMQFVALVTKAALPQQLVMLDLVDRDIVTYYPDGVFFEDRRQAGMDLYTHVKEKAT